MPMRVECAGFCAPDGLGTPYATSLVRADQSLGSAMVWTDRGGGSVHLLQRGIAASIVDPAAVHLVGNSSADARLRAHFDHLDDAITRLGAATITHRGTSAEAIVALATEDATFIATTGMCRAYLTFGDGAPLTQITLDETLLMHSLASHPGVAQSAILASLSAPALGNRAWPNQARRPWQVVQQEGLETHFLLCTGVVHAALSDSLLVPWALEALGEKDLAAASEALWHRGYQWLLGQQREVATSHYHYARHGALALVRVRREGESGT